MTFLFSIQGACCYFLSNMIVANLHAIVHMKLMQKYKEAPSWWYFSLFGIVRCSQYRLLELITERLII